MVVGYMVTEAPRVGVHDMVVGYMVTEGLRVGFML